jgi:hypothetical protein
VFFTVGTLLGGGGNPKLGGGGTGSLFRMLLALAGIFEPSFAPGTVCRVVGVEVVAGVGAGVVPGALGFVKLGVVAAGLEFQ